MTARSDFATRLLLARRLVARAYRRVSSRASANATVIERPFDSRAMAIQSARLIRKRGLLVPTVVTPIPMRPGRPSAPRGAAGGRRLRDRLGGVR
jgi:hypothetical protein